MKDLLPSGLASAVFHVLLLFAAAAWLRGCQQGMTGETGGEVFRQVGIVTADSEGLIDQPADGSDPNSETMNEQPALPVIDPADVLPADAPRLNDLLTDSPGESASQPADSLLDLPNLIGPGTPLSGLPPSGGAGLISPSAAGAADGGSPELKPGQTAFLGVADDGRSFVYVIDTSQSMGDDNRLEVAKAQLKSSLRLLQPNQQFQVVFYNEVPTRMKIRGQDRPLHFATATNVFLAEQEVDRVVPYHGTQHMPALINALSLTPDVIYFLTDGREPQLSPEDLSQLDRLNGGSTIHVIEFSDGAVAGRATSWLERLARQSKGQFREIVVRRR